MIENTLETKAKFFALYWGQNILTLDMNSKYPNQKPWIDFVSDNNYEQPSFLELTPLELISDNDAIEISRILGKSTDDWDTKTLIDLGKKTTAIFPNNILQISSHYIVGIYQYLISKGYALPWMGVSISELIERNWIKLKE